MKDKTHILFLSSWYPTEQQPFLGNYIAQLAEMQSVSNKVTVVSLEKNVDRSGQIQIETVNDNLHVVKSYYSDSFLKISKINAHKRALKFIQTKVSKIDLIHVHIAMTNWWHFLRFQNTLKVPLVYSEHGSFYLSEEFESISNINKRGLKRLLIKADAITCVSNVLRNNMLKNIQRNIEVIGNPLPKSWENININDKLVKKPYRFLHISTVDSNKNPMGIIDAISLLKEKGVENFQVTILSDESTEELKSIAVTKNIERYLNFLGPCKHEDLPDIYRDHHSFLLNSYNETFSIVLAEAMFFGLHVISTKVGYLSENAPFDETERSNPSDLAEKMLTAILKGTFSGQKSRDFVNQFSEDEIVSRYNGVYDKLINA